MLGAALNNSSLNAANALGAWLGGLVISAGRGYTAPSWVGVGLSLAGLGVLLVSALLHRRTTGGPASLSPRDGAHGSPRRRRRSARATGATRPRLGLPGSGTLDHDSGSRGPRPTRARYPCP